ncbi:MAG: exo-alpha-sialidase [Candidatus Hydrogenedentes bacterium]|nr:exo-alpha-sialidase [Candidatus Hydrogenedentota bacterium]
MQLRLLLVLSVLSLGVFTLVACAQDGKAEIKPLVENKGAEWVNALDESAVLSAKDFEARVLEAGGRVDFVFGDDRPFPECHASTVAQAPDGTMIAAWFGGTKEKDPDVGIWMSRLIDGQWLPPYLAVKVEETAHWNPVLFTDAEGEVHLFFKVATDVPIWKTWWMSSKDNGVTWSEAKEMVPGDVGGRGPVKNKAIILSDGAWLAPASTEHKLWESFADRSTDRGLTWERSEDFQIDRSIFKGKGCIQPTFWESAPGKVHALMRACAGRAWRADSEDYGKTWTPIRDAGLPNNNSGLDAINLEDGRVLLVLNPVDRNWGARTPLSLAISSDNGESWNLFAHFEDDPPTTKFEFSYPAIISTKEGIAVSYTWKRERVRYWFIPLAAL